MLERPDDSRLPSVRVSDADRNRIIDLLREHTGEGLLTLDEFSDRVGLVYEAKTRGELELVLDDLPSKHQEVPEVSRRRVTRWAIAIMGGHTPRGRFRLAERTNAIAIMGGCELDLRNAEIDGKEVEINCLAIMGGVDIIVPEGIAVDFQGIPLLGGTDCKVANVPIIPGSPRIVVRALAVMGGVTVKSRKSPDEEKALRAQRREARLGRVRDHRDRVHDRHQERHQDRQERWRERFTEPPGRPSGPRDRPDGPPPSRSIERVAEAVEREWPEMRARAAPDGTVTIMFSDIEGYTEMTERLGDRESQQVLRRHNELVRKSVAEHGGFEVKSQGDGFMIAFGGASRALRCAIAIQRALDVENASDDHEPVRVRMGLHTGEAIKEADDFLGRCVILASRIANEADGGDVLVSSVLRELTAATGEFEFGDPRKVSLKGMSQQETVYSLLWD